MKKIMMAMVCLMTMIVSVNAQNDVYNIPLTYSDKDFFESIGSGFVAFGVGVGHENLKPTSNFSHSSIDLDLICCNVLMSCSLGKIYNTSDISSSNASSFKLGCLIPLFSFSKKEDIFGRQGKGKIFIVPFMEWIEEDNFTADGHYLHDKLPSQQYGHVCTAWIDTSHEKNDKYKEFGCGVMAKYGCGYLLGTFTDKSIGVSAGVCF